MPRRFACVECQQTYTPLDPEKPVVVFDAQDYSGYCYPVKNRCELCSLAKGLEDWAQYRLSQKKT